MGFLGLLPDGGARGSIKGKLSQTVTPTGVERFFDEDEIIVSKTDLKGAITYANDVFLKIADYTETDILGAPHSILRHPSMPRAVFKLLWDQLTLEKEIFAYVVNLTKYGDHYWVYAHVTPSIGSNGQIVGYHSNRRVPNKKILSNVIEPLYATLLQEEKHKGGRKAGLQASYNLLVKILKDKGVSYDEFILSL